MPQFGTGLRAGNVKKATIRFDSAGGIVDIVTIPAGAIVTRVWANVKTVFNAGSTNVVLVGYAADDDAYLVAADVNEAALGVTPAGGKGPFPPEAAARTIQAKYTQSGGAATTGEADVYVEYLPAA